MIFFITNSPSWNSLRRTFLSNALFILLWYNCPWQTTTSIFSSMRLSWSCQACTLLIEPPSILLGKEFQLQREELLPSHKSMRKVLPLLTFVLKYSIHAKRRVAFRASLCMWLPSSERSSLCSCLPLLLLHSSWVDRD